MNLVVLGPEGVLTHNSDKQITDPLSYLNYGLQLSKDSRLRHFFKMIHRYPILARLSTFMPDLISQYGESPSSGCRCDDLDCLEFTKTIEMVGFPGNPRLEIYTAVKGKQKEQPVAIRNYALTLLLDLPICIGKLKHVVFGDTVDTFEFDTIVTLFEFIDGIVWELSFHVLPKECQLRR